MLTGKRIRLKTSTIALEMVNGKRVAITVPDAASVLVVSDSVGTDRIVNVLWESRPLAMLVMDLRENGIATTEQSARS